MAEAQQSGATVTVGCKLPHGLKLDMNKPGEPQQRCVIKGANQAIISGGYGITEGVPKDFFEAWMTKHKILPAVQNKLIFAMPSTRSAVDKAEEMKELRHGFEPIDPKKMPKGVATLNNKADLAEELE